MRDGHFLSLNILVRGKGGGALSSAAHWKRWRAFKTTDGATWMKLGSIMLSELSRTQKDTYGVTPLTFSLIQKS